MNYTVYKTYLQKNMEKDEKPIHDPTVFPSLISFFHLSILQ